MFRATWTWVLPVLGAAAVFGAVLSTTPPGFATISEVLFGLPRGATADAAAYALGSAGSLALVALLVLAAGCELFAFVMRRFREKDWGKQP
jgi:hypothetical protein